MAALENPQRKASLSISDHGAVQARQGSAALSGEIQTALDPEPPGSTALHMRKRRRGEPRRAGRDGRENDDRFKQFVEKMPTAVYAIDAEGRLTYFNRAAAELAGRDPVIGDDRWCVTWKLYRPDGSPLPHDQCPMAVAVKERREIRGAEAIVEKPDGARVWVQPYPALIYDESGILTGAVNVLIDITERKRNAEILAEADARKNEFLAFLAHELRNPLAAICNSSHVLARYGGADPAIDRIQGMLERQVAHIVRLVDDLLDVSRVATGKIELKKEQVDLAVVIDHAVETIRHFAKARGVALRVDAARHKYLLDADPVRLAQIFTNLLNNAVKFTSGGGLVEICLARQGDTAVVTVSDSGQGIPAAMLTRVFDLFMQIERTENHTQSGLQEGLGVGLGVGLALVRELVRLHGGEVEAHSEGEHKGSQFVVRLPLSSAPPLNAASYRRTAPTSVESA